MTDKQEIQLPEPDLHGGIQLKKNGRYLATKDGYTATTVRRLIAEAVAAEREACALACESVRDLREEVKAALKVADAMKEGDADALLQRLRHESSVRLFNTGLDNAAAAIRSRGLADGVSDGK